MAGVIFEAMTRYFDRVSWSFAPVGDDISIALRFSGDDDEWSCVAQALEDECIFLLLSVLPVDVDEARRAEMSEFVTRANYGMLTGAFELSLDTGDVRYRTGVRMQRLSPDAFDAGGLAELLIDEAVRTNVVTMNTYIAGLRAVIAGRPAAAAIEEIESDVEI